jgi:hypothetical protein
MNVIEYKEGIKAYQKKKQSAQKLIKACALERIPVEVFERLSDIRQPLSNRFPLKGKTLQICISK